MVNKEIQRRKIEGSKKVKEKTDKTERESSGYEERHTEEKGRKQNTGKVEHRKRKTEKSRLVGSEKTKMNKCSMLHLENKQQQRKEGRKQQK